LASLLGNPDVNIYGYECAREASVGCVNFPFFRDVLFPSTSNSSSTSVGSLANTPRVLCLYEGVDGCTTTWTGVQFLHAGTPVVARLPAHPTLEGISIRFTVDGHEPSPLSPGTTNSSGVFFLNATAVVTLGAFASGTGQLLGPPAAFLANFTGPQGRF
jgi:hypothetical protein